MSTRTLGIVMHGVTGRMGLNQHLIRSILAIRAEGGVKLANGDRVMPDPILVGRGAERMQALAAAHGGLRWGTDLDRALANPEDTVFFDAATTQMRPSLVKKAIAAGKHVYCEKPSATNLAEAMQIYEAARAAGVKHGVVQDKLWLPGLQKLKLLIDAGFFGRILSVRGEFGYWVFEGDLQPAQRPSWNYRKEDGGGIILDMLCHWRYVVDNLFGEVRASRAWAPRTFPNASTRTASPTPPPPTTRPTRPSSPSAASSLTSTVRGAFACVATTCSRCRSTARTARRWPGCASAARRRA